MICGLPRPLLSQPVRVLTDDVPAKINKCIPDDLKAASDGLDFSICTDMPFNAYNRSDGHDLFIIEIDRIQGIMAIYDGGPRGKFYEYWMVWPPGSIAIKQGMKRL